MNKKTNPAPCRFMKVWAALVLSLCVLTVPALAVDDPLTIVNNLSTFIFSAIRAIGIIILGWGICLLYTSPSPRDA